MKAPIPIDLSPEAVAQLKVKIQESQIDAQTQNLLLGLIDFCLWLQFKLTESKISISRLKNLFGLATKKKNLNDAHNNVAVIDVVHPSQPANQSVVSNNIAILPKKKRKGHGRNSVNDYTGAAKEKVSHPLYQSGDLCPTECGGKLYLTKAGQFIRVQGGSLVQATNFELEKLRCNLCGELFSPARPFQDKYDARAKAVIAVSRYQMGTPMYRLARFQEYVGVPLPEGTQWQLILDVYEIAHTIFETLLDVAAQDELFFIDDTWVRILDIIRYNKQQVETKKKKGTHTTGILAVRGNRRIYLYFSGTQHAGQNLNDVLENREQTRKLPIQMSDALSRNKVNRESAQTIECHCIEHGKRQFTDIEHYFTEQCHVIIAAIRQIYQFEQVCLDEKMTFDARLAYHQQHSEPVLDELKAYMLSQFETKAAEPGSSLGKAMNYWLKRWDTLTTFLRVTGAPIHNNLIEQGLKMAILSRKNSLFYKTLKGAKVGGTLMSVIRTAAEAGINPVEYLTALLENKDQVVKEPQNWLPWNYVKAISNPDQQAA
jgi:transposase